MKKILLAAMLGACFSTPALAQTSIQIYGIADAGGIWQRGGPFKVISGGADGSRLGFKGSEELGRGFKAIFDLEARVELDNGTQQSGLLNDNQGFYLTRGMQALGPVLLPRVQQALQPKGQPVVNPEKALFDRTSMVGMVTPWGALMVGRLYTPDYEVFALSDTFETGTNGSWGHILSGTAGYTALASDIRSSRSVEYRIVLPNGFGAALMAASKGSGYYNRYNKFFGVNLTYKKGPWDVGIGHNHGYDQQDAPSLRTTTAGGSYTWNDFKFFAGVHYVRNTNSPLMADYLNGWDTQIAPSLVPLGPVTAAALRNIFATNIFANTAQDTLSGQIGMHWRYGPGRVMGSIAQQWDRGPTDSNAIQFALGYNYFMSRRTDLYAVASFIRNHGQAQYSPGSAGSPGGFTPQPGEDGRAVMIGVRHRF
jgi:predicted porin